jgi:sialic acid synthase SpsE
MYIIAEIGVNHYDIAKKYSISVFDAAKLCIKEAKEAGANAAKFQTYTAEKIASKISPGYWDFSEESTRSQFDLFKKFKILSQLEWEQLSIYCKNIGIEFMSTAFDLDSVDILQNLQNYWKISSSDITNFPLIEKIAKQKGKILLSTGASSIEDIRNAINVISKYNNDIVIMHCILNYPTPNDNANLNMILDIKKNFPNYELGYSDHTRPDANMLITTTAYLYGAKYIEKHFTLDKSIKGNDHYHSMDPIDLKILKDNYELLQIITGSDKKICIESEKKSQNNARRSIYTACKLNRNDILTETNLICKRPFVGGISSSKFNSLIGKKINKDVDDDYQIQLEDLE